MSSALRARLAAAMLVVAIGASGCGGDAAATATPEPTREPPPADIQATLAWMVEHTMTCTERPTDLGSRAWQCVGENHWDAATFDKLNVTIVRNAPGATRVVGMLDATMTVDMQACPGQVCDVYTGFFSDTIALSPITGAAGLQVGDWIQQHRQLGGQIRVGPLTVNYRPAPPFFTLTLDLAVAP